MSLLEGVKVPQSVTGGACLVGGAILGGLITKKVISSTAAVDTCPEKWIKVGEIKELNTFPVKSLQGIALKEAKLGKIGLQDPTGNPLLRDRVFVIVDEKNIAVIQKRIPMMALIQVHVDGNKLRLSYAKDGTTDEITVDVLSKPDEESDSSAKVAIVMGETIKGVVDCGDAVATWICRITGASGLRLVYHAPKESQRVSVKRNSKFHTYRETHVGSFQDETSYLLMTEESLDALNEHIGSNPVSHKNFRPTIVVGGIVEPFAEDFWGYVRFGDKNSGPIMKTSLPCQRCKLTTVNPDTGEFRDDGEPLSTLYKLKRPVGDGKIARLVSRSALLGIHLGLFQGEGDIIRVGDPVYAALL